MDIEKAARRHNSEIFHEVYRRAYSLFLPNVSLKKRIDLEAFAIASQYEAIYYTALDQTRNSIYARDVAEEYIGSIDFD